MAVGSPELVVTGIGSTGILATIGGPLVPWTVLLSEEELEKEDE